jgi:hypothetical protein
MTHPYGTPRDRRAIAFHEAGHVVMAFLQGIKVFRACIGGNGVQPIFDDDKCGTNWGWVCHEPLDDVPAEPFVLFKLAGVVAQKIDDPRRRTWANLDAVMGRDDLPKARERAGDDLESLRRKTRHVLKSNWPAVVAVASRLLRGGVVAGRDLKELVSRTLP